VVEFDLANERVVLATMIHDAKERRRLMVSIRPNDFGDQRHRIILRGLTALDRAGMAWSEDTFQTLVGGADFGGFAYLRAIEAEYQPNRNVDYHLDRLRLDAAKFELLRDHVPKLVELCEDPKVPGDALAGALRVAGDRVGRNALRNIQRGGAVVDAYYETMRMRSIVGSVFEPSGNVILDSMLGAGFAPATVSLIVGRPGMGKSAFVSHLVRWRVRNSKRTYLGAWEMGRDDYLDSMIAAEAGIPAERYTKHTKHLSDQEKLRIADAAELFRNDCFVIEENPFIHLEQSTDKWADQNERNLDHVESVVAALSQEGFGFFVFDVVGKALRDRREQAVTQALIRIRESIAKRYGVHICLVHHLNRQGVEGPPSLEHIKNAGAFEEELDLIFGVDRPMIRAPKSRRRNMRDTLDLYCLKQRRGPFPFCVRYDFEGAKYLIDNEAAVDLSIFEREDGPTE